MVADIVTKSRNIDQSPLHVPGRQAHECLMFQTLSGVPVGVFELVQRLRQSFQFAVQVVVEGSHDSA